MSEEKVVVLNPKHPIPVRALWTIMRQLNVDLDEDGVPMKGSETEVRAWMCVKHWLSEYETRNGLPSLAAGLEYEEIHPNQAKALVCPYCLSNDGCYVHWDHGKMGYCTVHEVRWLVPEDTTVAHYYEGGPEVLDEYTMVEGVDIIARQADWNPPERFEAAPRTTFPKHTGRASQPLLEGELPPKWARVLLAPVAYPIFWWQDYRISRTNRPRPWHWRYPRHKWTLRERAIQVFNITIVLLCMPVLMLRDLWFSVSDEIEYWVSEFNEWRGRELAGNGTESVE